MTEVPNSKRYDLEERTYCFAEECRNFVRLLPRNIHNLEYSRQLIRSSGSQAANYIEANESLSKKDFSHRVKICRKEVKESCLWLKLCDIGDGLDLKNPQDKLIKEGLELKKIFSSIVDKSS